MKKPLDKRVRKNKNLSKGRKKVQKRNGKTKKIVLISLLAILIVAGCVGGIKYYNSNNQKKIDVYSVQTLNCADWWQDDATLSGTLTSDYLQEVYAEAGKEVEKIYVSPGDQVKEGDILLKYNMEEQELDLQLQDLQIQSSTIHIKQLEEELQKLKNTKTKGSVEGSSDTALSAVAFLPGIKAAGLSYLAEEDGVDSSDSADSTTEEKTTEAEKPTTEATTEKKEDTTEAEKPSTEATTEKKEETSEEDSKDPEEKDPSEEDTSSTEEEPVEKDTLRTTNIKQDIDRSIINSGDGKTELDKYVFLLGSNAEGEPLSISGEYIKSLITRGIYASFKVYESQEAYEANPEEVVDEILITPTSLFTEEISDHAYYTVEALNKILITVSKVEITPSRSKVSTGQSYTFKAKVTGKHLTNLTASWKVSGNKSKETMISGGVLWVAADETASKIKITLTVGDKSTSLTMDVKKVKIPDSNDDNGGGGGGGTIIDGGDDVNSYTADELKEAIADKEEEIMDAKSQLSEAKINYQEAKKEVEKGTVRAKISGTVKTAYSADALPTDNSAVIVVSADDGIYVKTQINEMALDTVKVGGTITCTSWETDEKYQAVVKEVSDYPANVDTTYMDGNPNSSYYPIVAYIKDAEGLSNGQSVSITYSSSSMGTRSGEDIYLQKAYVRSDSQGSYVFKTDEDNRLVKQYVKIGKTLNGQYVEILQGITTDDFVAFPYGKKVKEGAKTKVSENDDNIIY